LSGGLGKAAACFVLFIALVIVNIVVGNNMLGNLFLGILSAILTIGTKRYFNSDLAGLAGAFCLGVAMAPYFLYLLWYALVGVQEVSAQVASNYLVDYVNQNFITAIPSTFTGGFGAWIVEAFSDNL